MNGFGRKNKEIQTNCQGFHVHLHAGGSGDFGAGVSGRGAGGDGEIKEKTAKCLRINILSLPLSLILKWCAL